MSPARHSAGFIDEQPASPATSAPPKAADAIPARALPGPSDNPLVALLRKATKGSLRPIATNAVAVSALTAAFSFASPPMTVGVAAPAGTMANAVGARYSGAASSSVDKQSPAERAASEAAARDGLAGTAAQNNGGHVPLSAAVATDPMSPPSASELIGWPIPNAPITQGYGPRTDPVNGKPDFHTGTDFGAVSGTDIHSADDGEVVFVGMTSNGYGNRTVIKHADRRGKEFYTTYNHQSEIDVAKGDHVSKGQVIGKVGETGHVTGAHLHFEVILGSFYVDPMPWLTGQPTTVNQAIPIGPYGGTNGIPVGSLPAGTIPAGGSTLKSAIRHCESSDNYTAQNPTSSASGAYQFLDSTWQGIPVSITGGTSRALEATPAQQDAAFDWLFQQAGTSPWVSSEACWGPMKDAPTGLGEQGTKSDGASSPSSPDADHKTSASASPEEKRSESPSASAPGKVDDPASPSPSQEASKTPSSSPSGQTPVPSKAPSSQPDPSASPDPSAKPSESGSASPSPSESASSSPSGSASAVPSCSASPSASSSPSAEPTACSTGA